MDDSSLIDSLFFIFYYREEYVHVTISELRKTVIEWLVGLNLPHRNTYKVSEKRWEYKVS